VSGCVWYSLDNRALALCLRLLYIPCQISCAEIIGSSTDTPWILRIFAVPIASAWLRWCPVVW
jgi:hypothetical protein